MYIPTILLSWPECYEPFLNLGAPISGTAPRLFIEQGLDGDQDEKGVLPNQ